MKKAKRFLILFAVALSLTVNFASASGSITYVCPGWGVPCSSPNDTAQKQKFKYAPTEIEIPLPDISTFL